MRRIACIALPEIRLELAEESERRLAPVPGVGPLAVVVARKGGAVKAERDVLGNTRLDVVSRAARAAGIRPGHTVAAARAKHAELRVRVVAEDAVHDALARVAEVALAMGPATAFDVADDVVWVDVTGCQHLHGGEPSLAKALDARVRALGHACRVAVADGPRIASAVARLAPRPTEVRANEAVPGRLREGRTRSGAAIVAPIVVPPGKGASALRPLPVAVLALGDDVTRWLVDLGLPRCGDLQRLPRRSLGTRLGDRARDVMRLLDGDDRAPLDAWRPPPVPEERVELEWGAGSVEALGFVVKGLCDRLAARLQGRAMAAARLELELKLDRALCEGAPHVSTLEVALPSPLARAADLLAVLRTRLERHVLAAPALAVTLRAPELASTRARTGSLFEPEPRAERALPRLVAELSAELGAARVGVLALVDTWAPDERTRLVPARLRPTLADGGGGGGAGSGAPKHAMVTSALEPTRLIEPTHVPVEALGQVRPLVRVEAVEWWRRGASRRDFAAAWVGAGPGSGSLAWVELRDDSAIVRGWID